MAAAMISDRGLRKKLTQEAIKDPEKSPARKAAKRKPAKSANARASEQNNNQSKRPKVIPTGDSKADLLAAYQPWVMQTYGDLAKTKTITLRKYARILRALRGEECNTADSSKFRFWVKAKGFHVGKPRGYDAKPADGIVCRYSVLDVEGGQEAIDRCSGSQNDPAVYIPTAPVKNAASADPVYRKVAIVENFFDIIYTVHVDLEGRAGKHAGQKRTYRTITETYAFLPREAVTRFLMGCIECQRRPRSLSPACVLPAPSPSPTPISATLVPNGFHHIASKGPETKNGHEVATKNWENEIDASQHSIKISFKDNSSFLEGNSNPVNKKYLEPDNDDLKVLDFNGKFVPQNNVFSSVRKDLKSEANKADESLDLTISDRSFKSVEQLKNGYEEECINLKVEVKTEDGCAVERVKSKSHKKEKRPYNPLDVCNLTSKDPPKCFSTPRKRHLNPLLNEMKNGKDLKMFSKPWSPSADSMFSPNRLAVGGAEVRGGVSQELEIDYSVPITTTYLKHMRSLGYTAADLNKKVRDYFCLPPQRR